MADDEEVNVPVKLEVGQLLDFDAYVTWRHALMDRTREGPNVLKFSRYRMEAMYNGLACPRCGAIMVDKHAQMWIPGHYPQTAIKCSRCPYHTCRPL